jgi:hypothetical protein
MNLLVSDAVPCHLVICMKGLHPPVAESEYYGCGLDQEVGLIQYLLLPLYAKCYKNVSCYNMRQSGAKEE